MASTNNVYHEQLTIFCAPLVEVHPWKKKITLKLVILTSYHAPCVEVIDSVWCLGCLKELLSENTQRIPLLLQRFQPSDPVLTLISPLKGLVSARIRIRDVVLFVISDPRNLLCFLVHTGQIVIVLRVLVPS